MRQVLRGARAHLIGLLKSAALCALFVGVVCFGHPLPRSFGAYRVGSVQVIVAIPNASPGTSGAGAPATPPLGAPAPVASDPAPARTPAAASSPATESAPTPAPPATPDVPEGNGYGCAAAITYLSAHAAPGFAVSCPHFADGHQATTQCIGPPDCQPGSELIWIADPCPAAYMNEASNSFVLIGESDAPWDPYGYCNQGDNPLG